MVLFLDLAANSGAGATGTLILAPNTGTRTTVTVSGSNTTILMGTFLTTEDLLTPVIAAGLWDINFYFTTNATSANDYPSFYTTISYLNGTTEVPIATSIATDERVTAPPPQPALFTESIYVPTTILPSVSSKIIIRIYGVMHSGNKNLILYLRNGTLSHVHTTIANNSMTGPTGPVSYSVSSGVTGTIAATPFTYYMLTDITSDHQLVLE
jgi:hypothetical protein